MEPNPGTLLVEDARVIFRNFAGKEGMYNREGDRNFCLLLDEGLAEQLHEDGWNVKALKAREPGDPPQPYIQIAVSYKIRPPKVTLVTESTMTKTPLGEEEVAILDWIDIKKIDLILNPYPWSVNGKSGIKAYLKTLYVVLMEDELDLKYRELEDLPARAGRAIEGHWEGNDWIEGEVIEERKAIEA